MNACVTQIHTAFSDKKWFSFSTSMRTFILFMCSNYKRIYFLHTACDLHEQSAEYVQNMNIIVKMLNGKLR